MTLRQISSINDVYTSALKCWRNPASRTDIIILNVISVLERKLNSDISSYYGPMSKRRQISKTSMLLLNSSYQTSYKKFCCWDWAALSVIDCFSRLTQIIDVKNNTHLHLMKKLQILMVDEGLNSSLCIANRQSPLVALKINHFLAEKACPRIGSSRPPWCLQWNRQKSSRYPALIGSSR